MDQLGIIQLRIIPSVGAESFAKFVFDKFTPWVESDSKGRVKVKRVEFMEHAKNTAIYEA
jgi:6-pyruvoyltetrahydropterin/6-carboxytetrahydropterin synthase